MVISAIAAESKAVVFAGQRVTLDRGGGDISGVLAKKNTKTNVVSSSHLPTDPFLVIGEEILTWGAVDRQIDIMLKKRPFNIPPIATADEVARIMADARRKYASILASSYLGNALIAHKASEYGLRVSDDEISVALSNSVKKAAKNLKNDAVVEAAKVDSFFYKNEINYLLARKYIEQVVKPSITVSGEEVAAYKTGCQEENASNKRRNAELPTKIAQIREEIVSGKLTFEKAAETYSECGSASDGGDMGEYDRDCELLPPIKDYAFSGDVNAISPVIESAKGYHILRVMERDEDGETVHLSQILLEKHDIMPEISDEAARKAVFRCKFNHRVYELKQEFRREAKCRCAVPIRSFRDTSITKGKN